MSTRPTEGAEGEPGAGKPLNTDPKRKEANRLGGRRRAAALTPERRSEIARRAAAARWGRTKGPEDQGEEPSTN